METILTGIQSTGQPHIGNYLGAIKPAIHLAQSFQSYLFIADYHSLTKIHRSDEFHHNVYEVAATWLACGLNPEKAVIYRQSDIREIFELAWILACFTPKGFMNRAHSYKDKVAKNLEAGNKDPDFGISMGLFNYPILMSADILLFSANKVPVGEDQIQHIEFARDIAQKFNNNYGDIIKLPEALVQKEVKIVPGLDGRKMSKSYNNHIPLFVDSKKLRKLIMKIKTDSSPPESPKDPENSLIFDLYKEFSTESQQQELRAWYLRGIGWGEAKQVLFEAIDKELSEKREVYNQFMEDPSRLDKILFEGAQKARDVAKINLDKIREAVGV
ncbi:MAG: tryptophan--tRNA ligase [Bdellovibrionales bacterium]|nr:tryptophan--tRNA ligase [Bdellovibrionales bacterium]